jgi:DNA-binding XRE family transcriptional regulator
VDLVTAKQENQCTKRIGITLAKQRFAKNMTQETVAKAIGVEQETIPQLERVSSIPPLLRLNEDDRNWVREWVSLSSGLDSIVGIFVVRAEAGRSCSVVKGVVTSPMKHVFEKP